MDATQVIIRYSRPPFRLLLVLASWFLVYPRTADSFPDHV